MLTAAVTATFTVAGDVSSFNQNAFKEALATQMGVRPSAITLSVSPASVRVQAIITYPSPAAANAAATTLAAMTPAYLSANLGVTVQAVANVAPTTITVGAPSLPSNQGSQAFDAGPVIGVVVGVTAFVLLVAIIVCKLKLRQKKASTIVKAMPSSTNVLEVVQSKASSDVEMKDHI